MSCIFSCLLMFYFLNKKQKKIGKMEKVLAKIKAYFKVMRVIDS